LGWLVAALTNSHAPKFFGLGALLSIGAALQLLSQSLRAWGPPFGLFAVTFFITGLGQAYQDSYANTFVSSVKTAHRWLGFIHAMYGFGCLVSPFVATTVASSDPSRWMLFYLFPLGLSMVNLTSVVVAFRDSINVIRSRRDSDGGENPSGRNSNAMKEVRQVLKLRDLWIISLFYFLYLGVSFAAGGKKRTAILHFIQERESDDLMFRVGGTISCHCPSWEPRHDGLCPIRVLWWCLLGKADFS
jgi:fucose permease